MELTDEVIDKLSQLKLLKEEVEKRQRLSTSRQSQRLEEGLQQVQEQTRHLQSPSRGIYGDRNNPNLVTAVQSNN